MVNRKQFRWGCPRFGYRTALLAAVCFILPQMVIANSLLHHFYIHGAFLYDAGWFAYLATHALTPNVTSIPSIEDVPMLGRHVFLFFFPLSYIYQIFSSLLSEQVYFSIVQGAWAGMVSLAIFLIGDGAINRWLLAVVSVATGLNPFVFTLTSFPHVEMAMPAFIALFIASYVRLHEHRRLWWLPFLPLVGLLSIREDAGLHGFGVFILLSAYFWWRARERRDLWRFFGLASLICIGYSVVAFLVRQSFSPGDDTLVWKFVGSPPYAHLTVDLIWERLVFIASNREYVYIPVLVVALLAVLQRSPAASDRGGCGSAVDVVAFDSERPTGRDFFPLYDGTGDGGDVLAAGVRPAAGCVAGAGCCTEILRPTTGINTAEILVKNHGAV